MQIFLMVEQVLAFASSTNLVREVKNMSENNSHLDRYINSIVRH